MQMLKLNGDLSVMIKVLAGLVAFCQEYSISKSEKLQTFHGVKAIE